MKKSKSIILNHVLSTKEKIVVKSGKCRYNFRCQYNAVHEAISNKEDNIAMCFYIDRGHPIIHFLNVSTTGEFTDNTLGNWSSQYDYFLVKYIDKSDYFIIDKIFTNYRAELKNMLPFMQRVFDKTEF